MCYTTVDSHDVPSLVEKWANTGTERLMSKSELFN